MSKFPNKNPSELHRYFKEFNLSQLIELNRSYGPHFSTMEERLDRCKENLINEIRRLEQLKERDMIHQQKYAEVKVSEVEFQLTLQAILEDTDQTDRLIGRKSIGYSPMNVYEGEERVIKNEMIKVSRAIENSNETIVDLEQKKHRAVTELKILNSVIEEKKRLIPEEVEIRLGSLT